MEQNKLSWIYPKNKKKAKRTQDLEKKGLDFGGIRRVAQ